MHVSIINNKLKDITGMPNVNTKLIYPIHRYRFWEKYSGWKILRREAYSKLGKLQWLYFALENSREKYILRRGICWRKKTRYYKYPEITKYSRDDNTLKEV